MKRIAKPTRRPTRSGLAPVVAGVFLVGFAGAFGAMSLASLFGFGEREALGNASRMFLQCLQAGNLDGALAVCVEGPMEASPAVKEEDRAAPPRVPAGETQDAPTPAVAQTNSTPCRDSLASLRERLGEMGVNWNDVKPLAFGGVRARVLDPERMKEPMTVVAGNIYFESDRRVFAIEISARASGSARRSDRDFRIINIWDWKKLDTPANPDALDALTEEAFRAFNAEPDNANASPSISRTRRIFVEL